MLVTIAASTSRLVKSDAVRVEGVLDVDVPGTVDRAFPATADVTAQADARTECAARDETTRDQVGGVALADPSQIDRNSCG